MRRTHGAPVRARLFGWAVLFTLGFASLGARLFWVQSVRHAEFVHRAAQHQWRNEELTPLRGAIYDRNGTPLATVGELYTLFADPAFIRDPSQVAAQLAPLLDMDPARLMARLASPRRYVVLRRHLTAAEARKFRDLDVPGVATRPEVARIYFHNRLAAHVLGKVNWQQRGIAGVERAFETLLAGAAGRLVGEVDARRRPIPGTAKILEPPKPGGTVVLTIDATLQAIAEDELRTAVAARDARGGVAVMMDPGTGDVLALAALPDFDPNRLIDEPPEVLVNPAVSYVYEPGSSFKLVTVLAALMDGRSPDDFVTNCTGSTELTGHTIHCRPVTHRGGHGRMTISSLMTESCNIAAATLAVQLGAQKMWRAARVLGFGEATQCGLPWESDGMLPAWETWREVRTATVGFGHGVAVTLLQLLRAYCTVANGGWLVQPRILSRGVHFDGTTVERPVTTRRVLPQPIADTLRAVLVRTVEDGTARAARLTGVSTAGKTGTAQKPDPAGGYRADAVVSSFVGFVPADAPRLALLVLIDEPQDLQYGGEVAAPVFRAIARRALLYLGISPETGAYAALSDGGPPRLRTGALHRAPGSSSPLGTAR